MQREGQICARDLARWQKRNKCNRIVNHVSTGQPRVLPEVSSGMLLYEMTNAARTVTDTKLVRVVGCLS